MADEKIIIVDDEADVLGLCERILLSKGYQVRTAQDGFEAVKIAAEAQFDLLLTDIQMPGLNGLDIAHALRKSDPGLICVIMTGYSTMDMVIDALKLGVDEFIMKPFNPEQLSATIAKALEKERLRKENFRLNSLMPLFELNKTLLGTVDEEKVLYSLLEIAQKETRADWARLCMMDDDKVSIVSCYPDGNERVGHQQICKKLINMMGENGDPLTLNTAVIDDDQLTILEKLGGQALLTVPIKSQNSMLGILILVRKESNFAPSDSDFLAVLSGQAGIALENARLFTEIQAAYKKLKKLDHMKSEFINIAAHELRTPLAIVVGYTTVLESEVEGVYREYATNIMRNALRLRSLIDDMLSLQYLESGLASLAQDPLTLPKLVGEMVQDVDLMAEEKQLKVVVDIPTDFPEMVVDRHKLYLILVNLIHNAMKFTPKAGQVTIGAKTEAEQVLISIGNTGTFIPEEERLRIFDRFYQVESSLTREHGGIGLGLSIVRGMVDICGGTIAVTSHKKTGTIFNLALPLNNRHLEPRPLKL